MKRAFLFLLFTFFFSCHQEPTKNDYHIIYKSDKEGNSVHGSKSELINFIRAGSSIKVGWGSQGTEHRIEHISEPIWIAVLDDTEVIVHLDPQILSKTDWNNLSASYEDSLLLEQEWRVVITSKGEFDAVWYNRKKGIIEKRIPQNHIITWFARGQVTDDQIPLYKTTPE